MDGLLAALPSQGPETVIEFLVEVCEFVDSPWSSVRLPRIEGRTLHRMWFEDVVEPVVRNWHKYRCPACGIAPRNGNIGLELDRVNAGGAVLGTVRCRACGHHRRGARLVTACHGCQRYPLIIGLNRSCVTCGGLRCDDRGTGQGCGACVEGCASAPQIRKRARPWPSGDESV